MAKLKDPFAPPTPEELTGSPTSDPFAPPTAEELAPPVPKEQAVTQARTRIGTAARTAADLYRKSPAYYGEQDPKAQAAYAEQEAEDALAAKLGGARMDRGQAHFPGEAPGAPQPMNGPTSNAFDPGFFANRINEAGNFVGGLHKGAILETKGLANAFTTPFGVQTTVDELPEAGGKAGTVGQLAAQSLPWFLGPAGQAMAGVSAGGNATQEALERGATLPAAVAEGIARGGVAVIAPAAVTKVAGPLLGRVAGNVAVKIAPAVGEAAAGVIGRTAGAAGHGIGTAAILGAGNADVSFATGQGERGLQELANIPEEAAVMGALGGGLHLTGEAGAARANAQARTAADADLVAQRQAAETTPATIETPEQRVADIAALHTREGYATPPPAPNEATPPPAEVAANEAALQKAMAPKMAAEQEAALNRAIISEQAATGAAGIEAKQAAAEPARAAMASGAGLESHLPPAPPTEAERSKTMFDASRAIETEHQATLDAVTAARQDGTIGKPQRIAMEAQLDGLAKARHEETIAALQEGKPAPTYRPMAEEIGLIPKPMEASPAPETKGIPHAEVSGRRQVQSNLGERPRTVESPQVEGGRPSAAPSGGNIEARGREGRNPAAEARQEGGQARETANAPITPRAHAGETGRQTAPAAAETARVLTSEPTALQMQRKKVGRLQERLQRSKMSAAESTKATQEHAAEQATLSRMEAAQAPAAETPAPLNEVAARKQLTAALTGTRVKEGQRTAVVDTTIAHLRELGKPIGKTVDEMLAEHLHSVRRGNLPKGKSGGVEFLEDGKAIIHVAESADETTIGHELLHIFRRRLPDSDLKVIEDHYGITRADWNTPKGRKAEEKFVADAEREQQTGTPPTAGMAGIFARFKEWAQGVGRAITGNAKVKTTPEFKAVLDRMYTKGVGEKYQKVGDETKLEAVKPTAEVIPEPKTVDAEVMAPEKPITGIKNEVTAIDRERLGLPARETPDGRTFDEMYANGQAKAAADPLAAMKLLDELRSNPEKIVSSDTEAGLLLKHKVDLENGLQELLDRADKAEASGDANGVLLARAQLDAHRAALKDFTELTERAGTAAGRALVARQMMSGMDYSLSHMEAEAEAAKGMKLTGPEQKKVRLLYQDIAAKTAAAAKAKNIRTQAELEGAKRRWNAELRQSENAKRSRGEKIGSAVKAAPGFFKSLKASLDDSAIFRQGWRLMFTNPKIWSGNALRTFEDAWNTFGGKEVMDEVRAELKLNPYYEQAKQAKLAIGASEEDFPTSLPERIPVLGKVYKASENAFTAFQYRNRMQVFEKMMDVAKKSGVDITDPTQLRSVGKLVNSLTGRASLGKAEPVGNIINNVFFSARKLKSDWDVLTLHAASKDFTPFARKQAALNLAKAVGGTAMILLIAKSLDPNSVDFDPRSANFGKIKVGNTRFDVTGGVAPLTTLGARLATASTKSSTTGEIHSLNERSAKTGKMKFGSQTLAGVVGDFFANKLSPVASVLLNHMRGQRFNGERPSIAGDAQDLLEPMAIANFLELQNDTQATPALTTAGVAADFFGVGVNTYAGKKKP